MKKVFILIASFAIAAGANAQLKVSTAGNVGIGFGSPAYKLDVKGEIRFSKWMAGWDEVYLDWDNPWGAPQIYCKSLNFRLGTENYYVNEAWVNYLHLKFPIRMESDEKLKENIKALDPTLGKLLQLEGKRYNYKKEEDSLKKIMPYFEKMLEKETFGFIAQELEQVFPELVYPSDSVNPYYSINYIGMIPVLVEAIKEQQTQIENLQAMVSACCQQSPAYSPPKNPDENSEQEEIQNESPLKNTSVGENNILKVETAKLFQNTPNPFSANTEIRFEIPENTTSAKLLIHDMQGGEIKSYAISQRGLGSIIINGFELSAGMYMYTLLINNTIIDTKKMILTK